MVSRRLFSSAFGAALVLAGCQTPWPVETPPPPVQPAPPALQGIAIHVHQHVTPPETEQDRWDYHNMPGLTGGLRQAVVTQLQRAGYTVVVDRHQPHDAVALIQADWPYDRDGTATLVLSDGDGERIATFSARIPFLGEAPRIEHLEADAAVFLVDAISRSSDVFVAAHAILADRSVRAADALIAE